MFEALPQSTPDPILQMMVEFRSDERADKIDLGVGVYKDEQGVTKIMDAVRDAEVRLHEQQVTKSYIGPAGDDEFNARIGKLALAEQYDADRFSAIQAPGGCSAIRILLELAYGANPTATVWLSDPTWANHKEISKGVGLNFATHAYFDKANQSVEFDAMLADLNAAKQGDILLLHGCCHNPTGADLSISQWEQITDFVKAKGLLPLVDLAYMGFGDGLVEDTAGLRHMVNNLDEVLIAVSCSKNFAIYRERTGCAIVMSSKQSRDAILGAMKSIARTSYSMPPDHGAALVRMILCDDDLRGNWEAELSNMRNRLNRLRKTLSDILREKTGSDRFSFLGAQKGMFSISGATPEQAARLKSEFGIYILKDGRINVAGLPDDRLEHIADAFLEVGM